MGLKDVDEMERTLSAYIDRLEPQVDAASAPPAKDGKGPPDFKLYLAALSCCYDVKVAHENSPRNTGTADILLAKRHPVITYWETHWNKISQLTLIACEKNWEDWLDQLCMSLNFIFQSGKNWALNSQLLPNSLDLIARVAEKRPLVEYFVLVRSVLGHFAKIGSRDVDVMLVQVLGRFGVPVSRKVQARECPPDITAACFEMMGDVLWWNNLANGALQSEWLKEVFDAALAFLQQPDEIATHEAAITAVLRFFCSFVRWASEGPEVVKHAQQLWEGEGRINTLVAALLQLLAKCAENPRTSIVGAIAEVIRPMLNGPMEFEAKQCLRDGFEKMPPPLKKTRGEAHKLVETMSIGKVDQKRFQKIQTRLTPFTRHLNGVELSDSLDFLTIFFTQQKCGHGI